MAMKLFCKYSEIIHYLIIYSFPGTGLKPWGLNPAQLGPRGKRPELRNQLTSRYASSKRPRFLGFFPQRGLNRPSLTRVPSDSGHFPRTWKPVSLHNPTPHKNSAVEAVRSCFVSDIMMISGRMWVFHTWRRGGPFTLGAKYFQSAVDVFVNDLEEETEGDSPGIPRNWRNCGCESRLNAKMTLSFLVTNTNVWDLVQLICVVWSNRWNGDSPSVCRLNWAKLPHGRKSEYPEYRNTKNLLPIIIADHILYGSVSPMSVVDLTPVVISLNGQCH